LFEQWANQLNSLVTGGRTAPFHAGQSVPSATPEGAEQEKLVLVVSVVGQRNNRDVLAQGGRGQEIVPQLSRSHFQRQLVSANIFPHIGPLNDDWQLKFSSSLPHEPFIGVAAAATELVVEVGNDNSPPVFAESWCRRESKTIESTPPDTATRRD
jgi:hypothetical protein